MSICTDYLSDSYKSGLVDASGTPVTVPDSTNGKLVKVCKVEHQRCFDPITPDTGGNLSPEPAVCAANSPYAPAQSRANMGRGELSHSQELFALPSAPLLQGITLFYVSSGYHGPLGPGWSHNHDLGLTTTADGRVVVRIGAGGYRLYTPSGSGYVSQAGDTSALSNSGGDGYLLTLKNGTVYRFDSTGKIQTVTDVYGNQISYGYTDGDLTTVGDQWGRTIGLAYDTGVTPHRLTGVREPRQTGFDYGFSYDGAGFLYRVSLPAVDGGSKPYWEYTYYPAGQLKSKQDPRGNRSQYEYDASGRLTRAIDPEGISDPAGHTRGYSYEPAPGAVTTNVFTEKDSGQWQYLFDTATGLVKEKRSPDGTATGFTYTATGQLLSVTRPGTGAARVSTFYGYDANGNRTTESQPVAGIDPATVSDPATDSRTPTAFGYSYELSTANPVFLNRVTSIADRRNPAAILSTGFAYSVDTDGTLLTTITDPTGAVSTIRQHPDGRVKEVVDANQAGSATPKKTSYTYGANGLLESVTGPDGTSTWFTAHDANGTCTELKVKDAAGAVRQTVTLTYDVRNRLASSTVTASGQPDGVTSFGYDASDNLTSILDPELKATGYEYGYDGQVTRIIDATTKSTSLRYGASGCPSCGGGGGADRLTLLEDAKQQQTLFGYDLSGRLTSETDPLGKKLRYSYYDNGLVREKYDATTLPEKLLVTYDYDRDGRLTGKRYADGTPDTTFGYDANGRILTATNGAIGYTFAYHDAASGYQGRLKSVTDSAGRQVSYDRYDKLGQRTKVTILKGAGTDERVFDYAYDNANRPQTITSSAGAFTYGYDPVGRRATLAYPNGVAATFGHDGLNRLTGVTHAKGTATVTFATYTGFDKAGNRTGTTAPGGSESYEYDNVYRLKKSVTPAGTENYGYDAVGNRVSGPGAKDTAYAHDAANRMTHGRQYGYAYDDAGNQTARTLATAPERGWTMAWDAENRLKRMERVRRNDEGEIVESRTIDFSYDPFGRRIGKQLTALRKGFTTTQSWSYLYDGDDIALEIYTNEAGVSEKSYFTHGPGIDEHLALERGGQFYFYHADGLNSVTAITDASGAAVQSYSYDSFGAPKQTTGFRNTYLFTGRELDREVGLYYYRERYYDWMEGRFISKDPIGFAGGDVNLYGMTQNNPVNFIDPWGLSTFDPGDNWRPPPYPSGGMSSPGNLPARGGRSGGSAPNFIVSPGGTVYPVPRGATGPTPVINRAGDQTGAAFTCGKGGANGQVTTMRIMNPTPPRGADPGAPNGYIKYENIYTQGVDPYSGRTLPNRLSHFLLY